jgi:hypothetical protein
MEVGKSPKSCREATIKSDIPHPFLPTLLLVTRKVPQYFQYSKVMVFPVFPEVRPLVIL